MYIYLKLCGSKFKRVRGIFITQLLLLFVSSDEVCVYCKCCLLTCKKSKIDLINFGIISLISIKSH